jgi:hypothetical protein
LSYKHDFVVQALEDWNVDAVCIVNSDDLFTLEYLDVVRDALNDGADMVRFYSYVFVDTIEHRATFAPKAYPASGVVMTSALLDALEWKPWAGKPINRYLDTRLGENLDEVGAEGVALLPSYEEHVGVRGACGDVRRPTNRIEPTRVHGTTLSTSCRRDAASTLCLDTAEGVRGISAPYTRIYNE